MSRLIVKNLPKKVNEQEVLKHFSKDGLVTDVKLKYKKNGDFRGFGFIGFESEEMANKAFHQCQNTYFKQNKITVEICHDLDYKERRSKLESSTKNADINNSEAHQQNKQFRKLFKKKDEMTREKLQELMKNPDFIQYLKFNQKGTSDLVNILKKKYSCAQLEGECDSDEKNEEEEEEEEEETTDQNKLANQEISDLEYLQSLMKSSSEQMPKVSIESKNAGKKKWEDLHTIVIRTKEQQTDKKKKGRTLTKRGVKDFLKPLKCKSLRIPRNLSFVAYVGFKTQKEMNQVLMKDKSYLDGVRVRIHKYEKNSDGENLSDENAPWKMTEEILLKMAAPVAESGKLFVRNLWYSVTEEELKELFEKIGPLADVTLPLSKLTRKPKGFAHVSYVFPEHAVKALNDLDGTSFKGRVLHILPSLTQEENDSEGKSFKERKKDDQKKSASSWHNWNSLFLGSGAVIDLMAENFGTSKQQLFQDDGNQSVAVNLALGETQMVEETKRFLEEEGVSLDAFTNPNVQRSSTVMLAKNLPAKTSAQELKELFGRHGELGRVVLPPCGVTAVIEFLDPGEAKRAFRELAYSRFKYLPLYLEWAPILVFKTPVLQKKLDSIDLKDKEENNDDTSVTIVPDSSTTLYIKNLNFKTEDNAITEHFSQVGQVHSVLISKRRGLSQGYGFVQFVKASDANRALKQLQNSLLDGHNLTIKYSEKKLASLAKTTRKLHNPGEPTSAKILVKNIAFQATTKEIRKLFQTFGELKSVRLPNKVGSSEHRGFGFVEYITMEDAKKAFDSLSSSTHFYGRRLVLEWAKEEESVEELRRKTAQHFLASGPPSKKQKVEVSSNNNINNNNDDDS